MAQLSTAAPQTLFAAAFPHFAASQAALVRGLVLALAGSVLLTISAKVQAPMWPVPMTMQSFMVLFLGAALGPRLGAAAVALYLGQGLAGMPVFAVPGVGGPGYFMGPTGGFLVSFIPAAVIAGLFAHRGASLLKVAAGMTIAHALILLMGMAWLASFAQLANGVVGVGLERAFVRGVEPFILGSIVKVALATACVAAGWSLVRGRG